MTNLCVFPELLNAVYKHVAYKQFLQYCLSVIVIAKEMHNKWQQSFIG